MKKFVMKTLEKEQSFCTHIFIRSQLSFPAISLTGLEDPSTAVRCSPILYKLVPSTTSKSSSNKDKDKDEDKELKKEEAGSTGTNTTSKEPEPDSMIPGRYRIMFAVVTVSAVMVYDTQHEVERVVLLCFKCVTRPSISIPVA